MSKRQDERVLARLVRENTPRKGRKCSRTRGCKGKVPKTPGGECGRCGKVHLFGATCR